MHFWRTWQYVSVPAHDAGIWPWPSALSIGPWGHAHQTCGPRITAARWHGWRSPEPLPSTLLHHAVVFIGAQSADFEPRDLTRNRLDFQGNVVYVLDRGAENTVIMEHYPNRRYFLYAYNAPQARAELRELFP